MNRRLHLMRKIDSMMPYLYSPVMRTFAQDVYRVLQTDEDEISDLESRVQYLENELKRATPYLPDDFDE